MNKVLIVDDDEVLLNLLNNYLNENGYSVLSTADGPQGISIYKKERPDIVLLDIGLPSLDGFDALKEIITFDPEAKVIIITGYGSENAVEKARRFGAIAFFDKPIDIRELLRSIKKILLLPI